MSRLEKFVMKVVRKVAQIAQYPEECSFLKDRITGRVYPEECSFLKDRITGRVFCNSWRSITINKRILT